MLIKNGVDNVDVCANTRINSCPFDQQLQWRFFGIFELTERKGKISKRAQYRSTGKGRIQRFTLSINARQAKCVRGFRGSFPFFV